MTQDGFSLALSPPCPAALASALVPCPDPDCPCRRELLRLRQQAGYWQAMHQRAVARLDLLHQEMEELRAKLRLRERQLFERKSEKTSAQPQTPAAAALPRPQRPRGQQPGRPGPSRRSYDHLPAV